MTRQDGQSASLSEIGGQLRRMCVDCLDDAGVDGAGLAVFAHDGTPETVHATSALATHIEDLQFTTGEGPCIDAARTGRPVLVPDLRPEHHARWPVMGPELAASGVAAIFALPIRVGTLSLGCLDLHRTSPGPLTSRQLADTLRTVDLAGELLITFVPDGLDDLLPRATYRMVVHQAAGMAMVQLDVGLAEAMLRLRAAAYAEERSINDLAADIVARRRTLSEEDDA